MKQLVPGARVFCVCSRALRGGGGWCFTTQAGPLVTLSCAPFCGYRGVGGRKQEQHGAAYLVTGPSSGGPTHPTQALAVTCSQTPGVRPAQTKLNQSVLLSILSPSALSRSSTVSPWSQRPHSVVSRFRQRLFTDRPVYKRSCGTLQVGWAWCIFTTQICALKKSKLDSPTAAWQRVCQDLNVYHSPGGPVQLPVLLPTLVLRCRCCCPLPLSHAQHSHSSSPCQQQ